MFVVIICCSLIGVSLFYIIQSFKYWKNKGVTQETSLLTFIGDSLNLLIRRYAFCDSIQSLYNRKPTERYFGYYQFNNPVLMLRDPELIKQICVKDFEYFLNHTSVLPDNTDPLWEKNLFALKGKKWRDMRATLSPSFTGSKMRQMFVLLNECAQNFSNFLSQNSGELVEIELKDAFTRYATDVIATSAFGIKCDSLNERENEFFIKGKQATHLTGFWKTVQITFLMFIPRIAKMLGVTFFDKEVGVFFRKIVGDTVEYREKNHIERPDMINLLMNARKEDEDKVLDDSDKIEIPQKRRMDLTIDDITSQALLFFFAGFETVSTAMCFMAYELAKNPEIQQKLTQELDEYRKTIKIITYESLTKLPYLDMVFSETLRKWPPTLVTDRQCIKPYSISQGNPHEKPIDIEVSTTIQIPIWGLHYDPQYWENPGQFDPERFSSKNKDKINPYTYVPFGVGPRNCIGSRFAIMEVKAIFNAILERFEIVPIEKSSIPFIPDKRSFSLASRDGFWFGLRKRKGSV